MADTIFFPGGAPLPTPDTVIAGHAGGIPAGTPWPDGIPTVAAGPALPPAPDGVVFYRTPLSVGQGSAYIGLGAIGAPAQIPATGRQPFIRTVLLDTPHARIEMTAADRRAEATRAATLASAPMIGAPAETALIDDVLAGLDAIPVERFEALAGTNNTTSNNR